MNNTALFNALGISLGLTLILETGFFLFLYYTSGNLFFKANWNKKDILLVILVNTLTNPIVVLTYWILFFNTNWNTTLIIIALEAFAVLTEGFIYKRNLHCIKRPYLFSLVINTFSYSTGLLISYLL